MKNCMTTSESNGRFFYKTNRFESIRITNRIESIRIANWNALLSTNRSSFAAANQVVTLTRARAVNASCNWVAGQFVLVSPAQALTKVVGSKCRNVLVSTVLSHGSHECCGGLRLNCCA